MVEELYIDAVPTQGNLERPLAVLRTFKSPGHDSIPSEIMKSGKPVLL